MILVRVLWLAIALATGVGFLAYLAAWLIMPSDRGIVLQPSMTPHPQAVIKLIIRFAAAFCNFLASASNSGRRQGYEHAADRMKLSEAILALIEQKRTETGDARLGVEVEAFLIDAQFLDLETEISAESRRF